MDSDEDSDDYLDLQDVFKGHNLRPYNIQNETKAWELIMNTCNTAYKLYDTTLEEDIEILKKDDQEKNLTYN